MSRILDHTYIFGTVIFSVYSQLVMRWQVSLAGPLPTDLSGKLWYVGALITNFWVLTGILATFFAGVSWMLAMTKFEISYAYPFVSLNYILVLSAGFFLFQETVSITKLAGSVLVLLGIAIIAKG